jgi:hypothetical protein
MRTERIITEKEVDRIEGQRNNPSCTNTGAWPRALLDHLGVVDYM